MAATNQSNKTVKNVGDAPSVGDVAAESDAAVAAQADNAKLEHSKGGVTTRDDATDLGVPMLAGSGKEPVGPEDALGFGATRGDYRQRLGDAYYNPHISVPIEDAEPGQPNVMLVPQAQLAQEVAEVPSVKGGTEAPDDYVKLARKAKG